VGLPEDSHAKPPRGLGISLWGCLPAWSFLNQAFYFYSLTYLNPKPSGGSYEKKFPEGANVKASKGLCFLLEPFVLAFFKKIS